MAQFAILRKKFEDSQMWESFETNDSLIVIDKDGNYSSVTISNDYDEANFMENLRDGVSLIDALEYNKVSFDDEMYAFAEMSFVEAHNCEHCNCSFEQNVGIGYHVNPYIEASEDRIETEWICFECMENIHEGC